MTAEKKLNYLIETLGGLLAEKDEMISLKEWQLEQAKKEIETLKEHEKELEAENAMLEDALKDAELELGNVKGCGCYVD